jgi:hypothetical protein
MSLTSRVANLFSGSSTSAERDQSKFGFADDGPPDAHLTIPDVGSRRPGSKTDTMAQEEAEEKEGRPPYLHVRETPSDPPCLADN